MANAAAREVLAVYSASVAIAAGAARQTATANGRQTLPRYTLAESSCRRWKRTRNSTGATAIATAVPASTPGSPKIGANVTVNTMFRRADQIAGRAYSSGAPSASVRLVPTPVVALITYAPRSVN